MNRIDEFHGIHAGEHEPREVIRRVRKIRERERRREREEADRIVNRQRFERDD